nr:META domain-containing protein [uncultured Duganella sp.]
MHPLLRNALFLGLTSLAACTTPAPQAPASLADTSWTLVAYRPSSGAELRPARPDQYRLHFQADGRLAAQIDCNRGSGSWQATDQQGGIRFGPLALTRMMCPPAPLNIQLPAAIETLQSYRVIDGQLQLQTADHAGTYMWQRVQP